MKKYGTLLIILGLLLICFSLASADDDRSDGYRSKLYGTVEEIPAARYGTWTINGHQVLVSPSTRIEEEYGRAEIGAYVEVKGRNDGKVFHAIELETKRSSDHSSEDRDRQRLDHGEFLGRVSVKPEADLGTWQIGDREVVVDKRTRLDSRHGPLEVGAMVEVKGSYRDSRFHAYRIKRSSD